MKIAITSTGDNLDSALDPRFGRAKTFIVYDIESGEFEIVDNSQNIDFAQGAGIQAAQKIAGLGVECVITGNCGPNAFQTLQAASVKVMRAPGGTIRSLVDQYKAGQLTETAGPSVQGHGA